LTTVGSARHEWLVVSWRQWLRLVLASAALVAACSGTSKKSNSGSTSRAGKAGAHAAGTGGKSSGGGGAGAAANGGKSGTTAASAGESAAAGESEGGEGNSSGRSGSGGLGTGGAGFGPGGRATGGLGGVAAVAGNTGTGGRNVVPPPSEWTCTANRYGDGYCDCGCGTLDIDCKSNDIALCERCDGTGSCDYAACPGKIDPDDVGQCLQVPPDWTCNAFFYGEGTCDCGCGAVDVDCKDDKASSCEECGRGCSGNSCPGAIDPKNNAVCSVPDGWRCTTRSYNDGYCDCGCGIVDPDCSSTDVSACVACSNGCWDSTCPGSIDPDDNTTCTGPPTRWNCSARFYNDGSICNCGCGAIDPDCSTEDLTSCDRCDTEGSCDAQVCPGTIDPNDIGHCAQPPVPATWTCEPFRYADGYPVCDCGCGAVDPDCTSADLAQCQNCSACSGEACPGHVDPADTTSCTPLPATWQCGVQYYGQGNCDCGCGAPDPDCATATKTSCEQCPEGGGSCSPYDCRTILTNDNTRCTNSPPAGWTCQNNVYGDSACDCGCGVRDSDCADGTLASCEFCNAPGSCSNSACTGLSSTDNSKCN
jgi:hypothetical protein